ncbi:fibronectin type III domain-containing protein [Leucobacter weissii]|uniref:Fibronectin type III domain-containing protein n=1 Tax=Leucobacter weissii TaxID=1983706 RepID=A0A939S951_9MICO|nr:fibronectin type III domain-containing protein [Leucobacter weissii]MBO1900567.1 fibronectin type III domain-containing protein [Leucobacter weissii]
MKQHSTLFSNRLRSAATRLLGVAAATAVAVTALVPAAPALADEIADIATVPVAGDLNPIDVKVVRASGALKNTIVEGIADGLGRRGLYELPGLTSPVADQEGNGLNEASYGANDVVGTQWKPKYGWDYETVLEERPERLEAVEGGLRIGSGTDRIQRDANGLTSTTALNDAVLNLEELSDDAAAVLDLKGDDAEILTADSIVTTAESTGGLELELSTAINGLTLFGEQIDTPGGVLAEPVTRSSSIATDDVVALLRGLGVDPEDIDQYAPMVGSSNLAAELFVTASTSETGGLGVEIKVEVDLAAVSAGDEETPAGLLFDVELHADNTLLEATFGGAEIAAEPVDPPTVTELTPLSAVAGDLITVQGTGFQPDATTVTVGGVRATDVAVLADGTTLTFLVPAGAAGADLPVIVKTRGGEVEAGALTVSAPITITEHPSNRTIEAGDEARFTAAASGHPAPSVQWQFRTALGGAWTDIDGQTFPSALTGTLELPAEAAWTGLQVRALFSNGAGQEVASNSATLTVNQPTVPVDSDLAALASPVKVGAVALILTGQASGGTFAGLINGELSKGVELGEPGRFVLTETGTPAPGRTLRATYPADSSATGSGIGDLASGTRFGPVTVENVHGAERITSTATVESFLLTDKALDDKGRIGSVAEVTDLIEATQVTTTVTAPVDESAPTTAEARIGSLKILGEPVTEADGLVDGVIAEPITKTYAKEITDIPAVLEGLDVSISDYFEDPSELVGNARVVVEITVEQKTETETDTAAASGLVVTGKVELDLLLEPIGTAAAFVKRVEIASDGLGEAFNTELAATAVARNGAKLPEPGDGNGPGPVDPEPEEPEEPLPFLSYKPEAAPDRVILNPTATPSTSQNITWRTIDTVTSGTVEYWPTEAGSAQKATVQATTGDVYTTTSKEEGEYDSRKHSATLEGLAPATSYTYRVGTESEAGDRWSPEYTFRTGAAQAEAFDFVYLGDAQNDLRRRWEPAVKKAFERLEDAELVLHAGDQINNADKDDEWGEWFNGLAETGAQVNQVVVAGNHEYHNGNLGKTWRQSYTVPQNGPVVTAEPGTCEYVYQRKMTASMKDIVYYTDYQGVRFVTLGGTTQAGDLLPSSGDLAGVTCSEDFNFLDYWFQIQAEWLDGVLEENPGRWSVVSIHQPIFSTSEGRDNTHLRNLLLPTIEKHNVDLVLQGHDHTYGRGHLASNNVEGKKGLQDGPVYVVSVLGPKSYKLDTSENNDWTENGAERVTAYEGVRTYQNISVAGNRLEYQAYEWESGKVVDSFEICKTPEGAKVATKTGASDLPEGCDDPVSLANTDLPEVLGSAKVGAALQADRGAWNESGLSFAYQWLRDGAEIQGATGRSYEVQPADQGSVLSVRVTASKDGAEVSAESAGTEPVRPGTFTNLTLPTLRGTVSVGQTLRSNGGTWSQEAELGYQWLADGAPIAGATGETLTLTPAHLGAEITVLVTATVEGYPALEAESAHSGPVVAGALSSLVTPQLAGTARVGAELTATPGVWNVAGAEVAYQWLRDGQPIATATEARYALTAEDLGTLIGVRVTASAQGYADRIVTLRSADLAVRGGVELNRQPTVSGTARVGSALRATAGEWSVSPSAVRYQWLRNGKAIAKATGARYVATGADAGKRISVRVTATTAGYETATATSPATKTVQKGSFRAKSLKITGKAAQGRTVKAAVKWSTSGVRATYVWKVGGKTVQRGSKVGYRIKAKDAGKRITVTVKGAKTGFAAASKTASKKIARR